MGVLYLIEIRGAVGLQVLALDELRLAGPRRGVLVVLRCISISGFVLNDCADSLSA